MNSFSKPRIYTLLCRNLFLPKRQARTIFSGDNWFEPKAHVRKRQEFLKSCPDVRHCFETIQQNYKRHGIEALSKNQIHTLIDSAGTKSDDRQLVTQVVKSFCLDTDRDELIQRSVTQAFIYFCFINNDYESAKEIVDLALPMNLISRKSVRMYATLLYNAGLYEDIFAAYKAHDNDELYTKKRDEFTGLSNDGTMIMAALYQHGTDEAFRNAMEWKRDKIEKLFENETDRAKAGFSRGIVLFGWFAVEKGKYGVAVDFLERVDQKSDLLSNVLCYAKAKGGDANGAIADLNRDVQKSRNKWKFTVNPQVMDVISEEVKYFDTPVLNENFSKLCNILDKHAVLDDQSIRDKILEPIVTRKRKSEFSNYKNSHMSHESESDDVEDYRLG